MLALYQAQRWKGDGVGNLPSLRQPGLDRGAGIDMRQGRAEVQAQPTILAAFAPCVHAALHKPRLLARSIHNG
jgi:hypothetical protein